MGAKRTPKRNGETGSEGGLRGAIASWAGRAITWIAVVALVAAGVGWVVGVDALRSKAAAIRAEPVTVRFNWPTTPSGGTWVPKAVQRELTHIVEGALSTDPFDRDSIQRLHDRLKATGWFREINSLSRKPGGVVRVDAVWRAPAAVVVRAGCQYLIGTDSAPMQLPVDFVLDPSMFRIENPQSEPERDRKSGDVRYGAHWPLDDVDHALRLLSIVSRVPESAGIVAVDLGEYPATGHVLLRTDTGCVLNWGAPVDESAPGEASAERKLVNLRTILGRTQRRDRGYARIDINRGHVVAVADGRTDDPIR